MKGRVKIYEFGEFRSFPAENRLERNSDPISLPPRAHRVLEVLLENNGRVVTKDELIHRVWNDRLVEESAVARTVWLVRQALGDDPSTHEFIQTIPKLGYRFVADVTARDTEKTSDNGDLSAVSDAAAADVAARGTAPRHRWALIGGLGAIVLASAAFLGGWMALDRNRPAPILSTRFATEKLASNLVPAAAISPDGRFVLYASRGSDGQESVWHRDLETGHNVQVLKTPDAFYYGLEFDPKGDRFYFVRRIGHDGVSEIYHVPLLGGVPKPVAAGTDGWLSISRDGTRIAFVRCPRTTDDGCSLYVADADGTNERKLATRENPNLIRDVDISPDGTEVAFSAGESVTGGSDFRLFSVDIETGLERQLSSETFFNISGVAWLDDSSMLIAANRLSGQISRIWLVSLGEGGRADLLTKDLESYANISVDRSGQTLVARTITPDFNLHLGGVSENSLLRDLGKGKSPSFGADGRIYLASMETGNSDIWAVDTNGGVRRQLTVDPAEDREPFEGDDGYVYFTSNRLGKAQIWRMRPDGSDQKAVSGVPGVEPVFADRSGRAVYFRHGFDRTLWRIDPVTGREEKVIDRPKQAYAISPDGQLAAFQCDEPPGPNICVVRIVGEQIVGSFRFAEEEKSLTEIAFFPDGREIAYVLVPKKNRSSTLWRQRIDADTRPSRFAGLDIASGEAGLLALSRDGQTFAMSVGGFREEAILISGLK